MKDTTGIGNRGECAAAEYLSRKGFTVVDRNFKCRLGEIDIIAKDKTYIVFAEVKTRKSRAFAGACEYVDYRKQSKIIKTAQLWLLSHPSSLQPRFDVLEVYYTDGFSSAEINHIPNAFEVR